MIGLGIKSIAIIAGIVLSIVGVCINNWKVATIGNSIALAAFLLV